MSDRKRFTARMLIQMSPEQKAYAEAQAREQGISVSEWMRSLIDRLRDQERRRG